MEEIYWYINGGSLEVKGSECMHDKDVAVNRKTYRDFLHNDKKYCNYVIYDLIGNGTTSGVLKSFDCESRLFRKILGFIF
ncbi:MAG: hypothetical protein QW303_00795 [Nitrososphaerota archaeon]